MDYPAEARDLKHPSDQSVATYTGHSVLRTLIRCYFSPAYRQASLLFLIHVDFVPITLKFKKLFVGQLALVFQ